MRLLLSFLIFKASPNHLIYYSILLFLIGFGFLYLYMTDSRLNAPEANGNTWWNEFRPVHGMLYLLASMYAFKKDNVSASLLIFIDTVIGAILFINHRF